MCVGGGGLEKSVCIQEDPLYQVFSTKETSEKGLDLVPDFLTYGIVINLCAFIF